MKHAFSLVELSIVLVILGLLTGGILAGKSLIRAAELRSVSTEYQRYVTAAQAFRDKYFYLPGDIPNATSIWTAAHATAGTCRTTPSSGAETCNGNGDGQILPSGGSNEIYRFWQQLANAGLIEGSFTGVDATSTPVAGGTNTTTANVPVPRLSNGLWFVFHWGTQLASSSGHFDGEYGNALEIGAPVSGSWPYTPLFRPEELWNIDTKMDDGLPAQGKLVGRAYYGCTGASGPDQLTVQYPLSVTTPACAAIFRRAF